MICSTSCRILCGLVWVHSARVHNAAARRLWLHQRSPDGKRQQLEVFAVPADEVSCPGHYQEHQRSGHDENYPPIPHARPGRVPGGDVKPNKLHSSTAPNRFFTVDQLLFGTLNSTASNKLSNPVPVSAESYSLAVFGTTRRGFQMLLHDGHRFVRERQKAATTNWKCALHSKMRCKGRAVTREVDGHHFVRITCRQHTHPPTGYEGIR